MSANILNLSSANEYWGRPQTEVLIQKSGEGDLKHHCDALILGESEGEFALLCALPCVEQLGYTFCLRRVGHQAPAPIRLLAESYAVVVRGKSFGHVHRGFFQ